jgi:hypothetical protein
MERDQTELDMLLSKYRLTFNWLNPGMKWFLVGQMKGSNSLIRSEPQPANDIEAAKMAAMDFIKRKFL